MLLKYFTYSGTHALRNRLVKKLHHVFLDLILETAPRILVASFLMRKYIAI